jgi:hypothetical protein
VESWRLDPEVSAMWGDLMNGLVEQTRARIERDRAAGHAMGRGDAAAVAETLIWSTERIHYVGLAGIARSLEDPERIVDALALLWSRILAG